MDGTWRTIPKVTSDLYTHRSVYPYKHPRKCRGWALSVVECVLSELKVLIEFPALNLNISPNQLISKQLKRAGQTRAVCKGRWACGITQALFSPLYNLITVWGTYMLWCTWGGQRTTLWCPVLLPSLHGFQVIRPTWQVSLSYWALLLARFLKLNCSHTGGSMGIITLRICDSG